MYQNLNNKKTIMDKPEIHNIEPIINIDYIIGSIREILILIILIVIAFYIIKLYKKVVKFLDKNS